MCLVSNEGTRVGHRDLNEAIRAAAPGATLVVKGTCVGPGLVPGSNANFVIDRDLTLKGVSNRAFGTATLDGGGDGGVLWINTGLTVTLRGLTITNGDAGENGNGGGLFNDRSTVVLVDTTVTGNQARVAAGIMNNFDGTMTLTDSVVSGNTALFGGGGIYNAGTLTLADSTIGGNTSLFGAGGGIFNFRVDTIANSGLLTVENSTISGNSAAQGGGLFNQGASFGQGVFSLTNSTVSENSAGLGGGIWTAGIGAITDSVVTDNTAVVLGGFSGHGGGIVNVQNGPFAASLSITSSTVSGNVAAAGSGGGVINGFSFGEASGVTLTDSMVTGNTAAFSGGGIFNRGVFAIQGSSIDTNVATFGGGIFGDGALTFAAPESSVGGNTATSSFGGIANAGGTVSGGCPTILGQGVPPSTTTTGFVVFSPPNLAPSSVGQDYSGYAC